MSICGKDMNSIQDSFKSFSSVEWPRTNAGFCLNITMFRWLEICQFESSDGGLDFVRTTKLIIELKTVQRVIAA